ncbi:hypothetical protein BX616_001377 [Lobosporangium transversale]|nr:hypothetical protein BX616_001377 [Lobosporangium transversale]
MATLSAFRGALRFSRSIRSLSLSSLSHQSAKPISMTLSLTVYHNSLCGTCGKAIPLLEEEAKKKGFQLEEIEFKYNPLTPEQVEQVLTFLGAGQGSDEETAKVVKSFLRKDAPNATTIEEAKEIVAENPAMMERPIVVNWAAKKAKVCRVNLIYEMTKEL